MNLPLTTTIRYPTKKGAWLISRIKRGNQYSFVTNKVYIVCSCINPNWFQPLVPERIISNIKSIFLVGLNCQHDVIMTSFCQALFFFSGWLELSQLPVELYIMIVEKIFERCQKDTITTHKWYWYVLLTEYGVECRRWSKVRSYCRKLWD
jgi:hypothetical protein